MPDPNRHRKESPFLPPKFYCVTRTSGLYGSLIGIHFCTLRDMLDKFNLVWGVDNKIEKWRGNHFASFLTVEEAHMYWKAEQKRGEPPTHGY